MIYNEGTLQKAQRAMRRRHRCLQSQDRVRSPFCRRMISIAFAMFPLYFSPEAGRVPRVVYCLCNRRRENGKQEDSEGACAC
jgi:hypothetical protein